jgi:hypothetical protein
MDLSPLGFSLSAVGRRKTKKGTAGFGAVSGGESRQKPFESRENEFVRKQNLKSG